MNRWVGRIAAAWFAVLCTIGCEHAPVEKGYLESISPTHHYTFEVLASQAGKPGRTLGAKVGDRVLAAYTCTESDAAVALVHVKDSNPNSLLGYSAEFGVDSNGDTYPLTIHSSGPYCFVTILRGFAQRPQKITVDLKVFTVKPITSAKPVSIKVEFADIAEPKRYIEAPQGADLLKAETVAKFFEGPKGLTLALGSHMPAEFEIVASSFSPNSEGVRGYLARTDAVKLRVSPYVRSKLSATLVYHGAKLSSRNGFRGIEFPTTQEVGNLAGYKVVLGERSSNVDMGLKLKHSTGAVSLTLARLNLPKGSPGTYVEDLNCLDIEPSLKDLGLEWIDIGTVSRGTQRIKEPNPNRNSTLTEIPELKFHISATTRNVLQPFEIVVPVHHLKR